MGGNERTGHDRTCHDRTCWPTRVGDRWRVGHRCSDRSAPEAGRRKRAHRRSRSDHVPRRSSRCGRHRCGGRTVQRSLPPHGRSRRADQQRRSRRTDSPGRGHGPRRLRRLCAHQPRLHVSVHPQGSTDVEGTPRLDRQHLVDRWDLRIPASLALRRGEMGCRRVDQDLGDGAGRRRDPSQRDMSRIRRGVAHGRGHRT